MSALSFEQLEIAYIKIYENAVELSKESAILKEHKAIARSYALLQFACEELGKLPLIVDAASQLILKEEVDWKKFDSNLRSHTYKNSMHQLIALPISRIIKSNVKSHTKTLNDRKNSSLYADFYIDNFLKPSEFVNKWMLAELELRFGLIHIEAEELGFHNKGTMKEMLSSDNGKFIMKAFRDTKI